MKVQLTVDVSDEALIAIGLSAHNTLTRATRVEAREFLVVNMEQLLADQEEVVKRITANVLDSLGMNLVPMDATAGANEAARL